MLYILVNWLQAGVTGYALGKAFLWAAGKLLFREGPAERSEPPLLATILVGLAVVSALTGVYHLFAPISAGYTLALLGLSVGLLPFVRPKKWLPAKGMRWYEAVLAGGLVLVGISKVWALGGTATLPSHHYDDGLYYQPFIGWLTGYPVVPGLGNLHFRLANNSTWHLLSAVFQFGPFPGVRFNDLNAFLLLLVVFTSLRAWYRLLRYRENTVSNYLQILLLPAVSVPTSEVFFTVFNYSILTSPAPDFPACVLVWLLFIVFVQKIEENALEAFDQRTLLLLVLAVFALTIKLSVAPVALFLLLLPGIEMARKRWRNLAGQITLLTVLLAPWCIGNVLQSGYLVFPLYQLDVFNFDWEMPRALVQYSVAHVGNFIRTTYGISEHAGPLTWIPQWYRAGNGLTQGFLWLLAGANALHLAFLAATAIRRDKSLYTSRGYLVLTSMLLTGCAAWLLAVPDFRFGFGFTVIGCLLPAAVLLKELLGRYRWPLGVAGTVYLVSVSNFGAGYARELLDPESRVYRRPDQTHLDPVPARRVPLAGGGAVRIPREADQCWGTPAPCTPGITAAERGKLVFRGKTTGQGFAFR